MKKNLIMIGMVVLLLAAFVGWQIGACYVANSELQSDLQDLSVQSSARTGLTSFETAEELRSDVVEKAKEHGIQLTPTQVMVQRSLVDKVLDISLAVDYDARVNLYVFSFPIHFTPAASHRAEIIVK